MPTSSWVFRWRRFANNFTEAWSDLFFDGFDIFLRALCQLSVGLLAWIAIENQNEKMSSVFRWIVTFLFQREEINDKFLLKKLLCPLLRMHSLLILCNRVLFRFKQNFQNFQQQVVIWWNAYWLSKVGLDRKIFGSRSGGMDLEPNIFPSSPPTQSIST